MEITPGEGGEWLILAGGRCFKVERLNAFPLEGGENRILILIRL